MFIRSVTVKGHTYARLVESYRANGKVKQRYVATLFSHDQLEYNTAANFADYLADLLNDHTNMGDDSSRKSKKESKKMLEVMAEEMLDEYEAKLKSKQTAADRQVRELELARVSK